mmetsp:Transcript_13061/g.16486  ORF Transcript_13061/g.16486 Transcript_13061/m.16486 type:complete len:109 (-) Transcript_13061:104-430(-)
MKCMETVPRYSTILARVTWWRGVSSTGSSVIDIMVVWWWCMGNVCVLAGSIWDGGGGCWVVWVGVGCGDREGSVTERVLSNAGGICVIWSAGGGLSSIGCEGDKKVLL